MILNSLKLQNFRNLQGEYRISKGINLIEGDNGIGKTNFLEAIKFLSSGKSFRTSDEQNVLNRDKDEGNIITFTRVVGKFKDNTENPDIREVVLEKQDSNSRIGLKKTLKVSGKKLSLSKFIPGFPTVLFSPMTVNIVTGSPAVRRRDIDDLLNSLDEDYLRNTLEYRKVIRNRNRILENIQARNASVKELYYWDEKLCDLGSKIISQRIKTVRKINPIMKKLSPDIFKSKLKDIKTIYDTKFSDPHAEVVRIYNALKYKLENNRQKEVRAGLTLYGPQRDDLVFIFNGDDLREFGSRGQQRLFSFLYKYAQWELIKDRFGLSPLFLLDDIFSELDKTITANLCRFLGKVEGQIMITTAEADNVNLKLLGDFRKIRL